MAAAAREFVEAPLSGLYKRTFMPTKKVVVPMKPEAMRPEWAQDLEGAKHTEPPVVRIYNARLLQESAESPAAFFQKHGFVLLRNPTRVRDWNMDYQRPAAENEVAGIYSQEVEELLRSQLFASGPAVRIQCPNVVVCRGAGTNPYAEAVHGDYALTADDFQANITSFTGDPEQGRSWRDIFERTDVRGSTIVNLWRPIKMSEPLRHMPLALLDPNSVKSDDLVPMGIVGFVPTQVTPSFQLSLKHDPDQMWYYYPDMTCDEVIAFKVFEYFKGSGAPLTSCLHTAFEDPTTPEGAEKRQSCEYRVEVQHLVPQGLTARL